MSTSGGRRDPQAVGAGFARWCREVRPDLGTEVQELTHPSDGMSNETVIVRLGTGPGGAPGRRVVLRLPPVLSSFPDQDFLLQARVQTALAGAGLPTVVPLAVETDPDYLGAPFIVMPFVRGTIPGPASLFDPWLVEATPEQRRDTQHEMVRVLADVQRVDWVAAGLDELLIGGQGRLGDQIDWWSGYLHRATEGVPLPRIEAVLDWCRRHRPPDEAPPSLVWGDPRPGNLVMDDRRRTVAVLDWDLATIGPAEMDLGWYLGLERVLLELMGREPLDGMAGHQEVAADYERAIGRPLADMAWHEIFAVLRSICINVRQAAIAAEAGVDYLLPPGEQNPLLGVVERWVTEHPAVTSS
jgi:aminoglycoside phosphotransferase (APT) family kinase protein